MDLLFPYHIPVLYHFGWLVTLEFADNSHYNSSPSLSEKSRTAYLVIRIFKYITNICYVLHITQSRPSLTSVHHPQISTNYI